MKSEHLTTRTCNALQNALYTRRHNELCKAEGVEWKEAPDSFRADADAWVAKNFSLETLAQIGLSQLSFYRGIGKNAIEEVRALFVKHGFAPDKNSHSIKVFNNNK